MTAQTESPGSTFRNDCLFCKMAAGIITVALEYDDEECIALRDINPQAPLHLLIIPRRHISSLTECSAGETTVLGHLLEVSSQLASRHSFGASGYRVVINTGADAGQSVAHLHLHLLAGRLMSWPPG